MLREGKLPLSPGRESEKERVHKVLLGMTVNDEKSRDKILAF